MYTALDMSHDYQQIVLDEDSKQYVTANTHKGLYKYNWLPFGVPPTPAIFQRTLELLIQEIPHVAVHLDDILITDITETEHSQNLAEVLNRLKEAGLCLKEEKCYFLAH